MHYVDIGFDSHALAVINILAGKILDHLLGQITELVSIVACHCLHRPFDAHDRGVAKAVKWVTLSRGHDWAVPCLSARHPRRRKGLQRNHCEQHDGKDGSARDPERRPDPAVRIDHSITQCEWDTWSRPNGSKFLDDNLSDRFERPACSARIRFLITRPRAPSAQTPRPSRRPRK